MCLHRLVGNYVVLQQDGHNVCLRRCLWRLMKATQFVAPGDDIVVVLSAKLEVFCTIQVLNLHLFRLLFGHSAAFGAAEALEQTVEVLIPVGVGCKVRIDLTR